MSQPPLIKIILFISLLNLVKSQCLVDKCASCTSPTINLCNNCESGWYKRTFTGGDKEYHECWSLTKLWLGVIGGLLLSLLICGICYYCYLQGKKTRLNNPSNVGAQNMMTEPTMVKEQQVIYQPQAQAYPQPVYNQPEQYVVQ